MEGVPGSSKMQPEIFHKKPEESREERKRAKGESKSETRGTFACGFCPLNEHFDYKGTKPPFARQLLYLEDCYIMKDPFSPLNQGETLVLGADCSFCKTAVCLGCSIFYTKRFCKKCALAHIKDLPKQLHKKIIDLSKDEKDVT
ncbi:cysteine-rich DPF motif domain-containing protein 1 [Belonocnema kinseyi]|uniref:cysteine-rich DPF motif domain-containing protein 1 n=1 Tax=Belonocnema kinseyi TaxID=2817044 RepID=UPI00143CC227|nr:cysteine-rich DPF motif domain-containing protein 1 [Belonocnema kinseyi]